jgi:hypothetical protein
MAIVGSGMPEAALLISPRNIYNSLSKLVEASGHKSPQDFFTDPDSPEAQERYQQLLQSKQQAPQTDPVQLELVKAQTLATQSDAQTAIFNAQLKQVEGDRKWQLEKMKLELDTELELLKMEVADANKAIEVAAEADAISQVQDPQTITQAQLDALQQLSTSQQVAAEQQPDEEQPPAEPQPDATLQALQGVQQSVEAVKAALLAKRRIVRDEKGRATHSEVIIEDNDEGNSY